jgi:ribonuclease BN (tRNA processing enzyme)
MELIILGSGTGVPSLKRGSPAALIKTDEQSILLDSGSGTVARMLHAGVTYKDLDAVLYTHIHPDHSADLVPLIFACKYEEDPREKDLLIIGGRGFRDYFEGLRWLYGSWIEPQTFRIHIREVLTDEVKIGALQVTAIPLEHAPESVGYRVAAPQGQTLVYSGDTHFYPPCDHADIRADCRNVFPGEVLLAEDMMRIRI